MGEVLAEAVEDIFGFEVPKRLELEPLCDIFPKLLNFDLNKREGTFEGTISEVCQLQFMGSARGWTMRTFENQTH